MNANCPQCSTALDVGPGGRVTCGVCQCQFSAVNAPAGSHICRTCGTAGNPAAGDWSGTGGFLLQCGLIFASLVALLAFFPLGVLLLIGTVAFGLKRLRDQRSLCPGCGGRDLIPLGTPAGQQLAQQFHA